MPHLYGSQISRAELSRRVGRLEQTAGVRLVTLGDGLERGVRVLEFRTGSGFVFDVLVDRAFDIGRCESAGVSLAWQSNAGVIGPWFYEPEGWGWFRGWGGGMVVTCGLDHTLAPGEDSALDFGQPHIRTTVPYGLHGRVGGLPARLVGYGEQWDGDECVLWAEGEVLQSEVFGAQLLLRRRIEARVGESRFRIIDQVENVGYSRTSHMLLYHCNLGWPVVDEGSRMVVTSSATTTAYDVPIAGYDTLTGPRPGISEACFEHELVMDADGRAWAGVINEQRGIGVYQAFRPDQLPHHTVWRMLGEGTYAFALEPGTNRDSGRWDAIERDELVTLGAGERRDYELEMGALVGAAEVATFAARVSSVGLAAGVPA